VKYIIKDSGAKIFFVQDKFAFEKFCEILPECETIEKLVFLIFLMSKRSARFRWRNWNLQAKNSKKNSLI
ncbi:MAG: hypothetical protein ACR2LT_02635, partial [Pyrinomonadaceae bacterium]